MSVDLLNTRLEEIGEDGVISEILSTAYVDPRTITGIGDDTAVLESPLPGMRTLFTTDMLVEGRHFDLATAGPYEIGWKALGCSLSDIAAMGGRPRAAVVSLGAPPGTTLGFCRELYRGINDLGRKFNCGIAGGDTVGNPAGLVLSVAVMGEVEERFLVRRSGARPGDTLWVTGALGDSQGGTHLRFIPRVDEARFLVCNYPLTAMIDLSDGLATDLRHLAHASGVGARIISGDLPLATSGAGKREPGDMVHGALYDGEDFELLFALSRDADTAGLISVFSKAFDCGITRIGEVVPSAEGCTISTGDNAMPIIPGGFSHFE